MRQNTVRIALGTFFAGFSVSAAARPTPSVPWKENPATKNTVSMEVKPPTNGACVPALGSLKPQLWNPLLWLPSMPAIIKNPTATKMTTVTTLIPANQYSASAYARTDRRFNASRTAKNPMAQNAEFECGNQNWTIRAPATSSAASVMAQLNQ